MMHGDIDISVVRDTPYSIEEVFDIFKVLYFEGTFRSYFIGGDWDDPRKGEEFPNGYYIGLKEKIDSARWKIDMWFMSAKEYAERPDNLELAHITEEQRTLILECKQLRNERRLSISGQMIYDLVLSGKVARPEDILLNQP